MRKGQKDIQLPSYNELLGIDDFVNHEADQIVEVPLSELHPFKDHRKYLAIYTIRYCFQTVIYELPFG